jgi:hypothetical protein
MMAPASPPATAGVPEDAETVPVASSVGEAVSDFSSRGEAMATTVPDAAPDFAIRAVPVVGDGSRSRPAVIADEIDMQRAEQRAADATARQQSANNGKAGHIKFKGLKITIQVPRGGTRRGVGQDGEEWETPDLKVAYGHARGSRSKDGEPVDIIMGPDTDSDDVYLIDQVDPKTGTYDETKAIIAMPSSEEALRGYASLFSDGGQWAHRIGAVHKIQIGHFRKWAESNRSRRPFDRNLQKIANKRSRRPLEMH